MKQREMAQLEGDPLAHLDELPKIGVHSQLSGCYTVLPYTEVCYDWNGTQVQVCLKVAGVQVGCATLDAAHPSITLEGSLLLVKASVTLTLDLSSMCLTYEATGCYRATPWSDWNCSSTSGQIVCF